MKPCPASAPQVFSLLALELKVFPELAREDGVNSIACGNAPHGSINPSSSI
jgi:hypothetical protein